MNRPTAPLFLLVTAVVVVVGSSCGAPLEGQDLAADFALEPERTCGADDARVGERFTLTGRQHGVEGVVTVVDDCTLTISEFAFDGGGLDVRAIVAPDLAGLADDDARVVLSSDLRRSGGYVDAAFSVTLPEDVAIDDVGAFSIWCLPAAANLADTAL